MPNVTGMTITEAKKVLKDVGLEYETQMTSEGTTIENAVIIDQLPKQGISIAEGTKIILYVE